MHVKKKSSTHFASKRIRSHVALHPCGNLWKMTENSWYAFGDGSILGSKGSEDGTILRDEEHPLGARITLERDGHTAPFAITCGIYGWMVHTRFFGLESEANPEYDLMKSALSELLERASQTSDGGYQVLMDGVSAFVERYP